MYYLKKKVINTTLGTIVLNIIRFEYQQKKRRLFEIVSDYYYTLINVKIDFIFIFIYLFILINWVNIINVINFTVKILRII